MEPKEDLDQLDAKLRNQTLEERRKKFLYSGASVKTLLKLLLKPMEKFTRKARWQRPR